jgi:hypothetical protein
MGDGDLPTSPTKDTRLMLRRHRARKSFTPVKMTSTQKALSNGDNMSFGSNVVVFLIYNYYYIKGPWCNGSGDPFDE